MLYRESATLCLSLALVWTAPDLLGQSTVELQPATAGDAFKLSAVNLPKRGVSVVWKAAGDWPRAAIGRRYTHSPSKNRRRPPYPSSPE